MKNLRAVESIDLGRRLLDKSLKDLGSSLRKVGKVRMNAVLQELGLNGTEELFEQLGLGERLAVRYQDGRVYLLERVGEPPATAQE